jgi:peroxiredoxin
MPEFEAAYQSHREKGFTILAINNRETPKQVADFRKAMKLTFPLVMDEDGRLEKQFNIQGFPATYVLDRKGVIIHWQPGPLTAQQISELVDKAVSG